MLKGNERRIIVIERMGDPYFEKAVFYLRCGVKPRKGGGSLADRAQELFEKMTEEYGEPDGELPQVKQEEKGNKQRGKGIFKNRNKKEKLGQKNPESGEKM